MAQLFVLVGFVVFSFDAFLPQFLGQFYNLTNFIIDFPLLLLCSHNFYLLFEIFLLNFHFFIFPNFNKIVLNPLLSGFQLHRKQNSLHLFLLINSSQVFMDIKIELPFVGSVPKKTILVHRPLGRKH